MGRNDASQKRSQSREAATLGASHSAQNSSVFTQTNANFVNSYLPFGNPFNRLGPGALTDRHKNTAAEMLRRPLPPLLKGPHPGGAFTVLQDCPTPSPSNRSVQHPHCPTEVSHTFTVQQVSNTVTIPEDCPTPSPSYRSVPHLDQASISLTTISNITCQDVNIILFCSSNTFMRLTMRKGVLILGN